MQHPRKKGGGRQAKTQQQTHTHAHTREMFRGNGCRLETKQRGNIADHHRQITPDTTPQRPVKTAGPRTNVGDVEVDQPRLLGVEPRAQHLHAGRAKAVPRQVEVRQRHVNKLARSAKGINRARVQATTIAFLKMLHAANTRSIVHHPIAVSTHWTHVKALRRVVRPLTRNSQAEMSSADSGAPASPSASITSPLSCPRVGGW